MSKKRETGAERRARESAAREAKAERHRPYREWLAARRARTAEHRQTPQYAKRQAYRKRAKELYGGCRCHWHGRTNWLSHLTGHDIKTSCDYCIMCVSGMTKADAYTQHVARQVDIQVSRQQAEQPQPDETPEARFRRKYPNTMLKMAGLSGPRMKMNLVNR